MVRHKIYNPDAQVDNVIIFPEREKEKTKKAKNILQLKQCGVTKKCITNSQENPYRCDCFRKCEEIKEIIKLFL